MNLFNMDEYFVEEKTMGEKVLDFLVFLAVFAVTIFLILEILGVSGKTGIDPVKINDIYYWVNMVVFIIFAVDLVRLWKHAEGAKDFFAKNWLDVLATIPFGLIATWIGTLDPQSPTFAVLKMSRLSRLTKASRLQKISRISKISKEFKAASHLKKEGEEYQRKHRL